MTTYLRRVLHGTSPTSLTNVLDAAAVRGCWFELHRQGGCGRGELRLQGEFAARDAIAVGDWIACDARADERWYLGCVTSRVATAIGGVTLQLEGMGAILERIRPGGFDADVDGHDPLRFGATEPSVSDPDAAREVGYPASTPDAVVRLLIDEFVAPHTPIVCPPERIEAGPGFGGVRSLKFHGEESLIDIFTDLALRARQAAWGVDEQGEFFFEQPRSTLLGVYQEGVDVRIVEEADDRGLLVNRLLLTGGYRYDDPSGMSTPIGPTRWRGTYWQPDSVATYGDHPARMWVPWVRTAVDAERFAREFFRVYAQPQRRMTVEVLARETLPRPWSGVVEIRAVDDTLIYIGPVESLHVQFDAVPKLRLSLGPVDPRTIWPEPPYRERYPLPRRRDAAGELVEGAGGPISLEDDDGVTGCPGCAVLPFTWNVTLTLLEDGACEHCATLLGTHALEYRGLVDGACLWDTMIGSCGDAGPVRARIEWSATATLLVFSTEDNDIAGYSIAAEDRTCHASNTLTFAGATSLCIAWPATLTIEPGG